MHNAVLIARKEYRDAVYSRVLIVILLLLLGLMVSSIFVSSLLLHRQISEYQSSLITLQNLGKAPIEVQQVFPLTLLRGFIDYIEIIGAILGILLGYYSIAKEKNQRTLQLLLTRPVKQSDIFMGKLLGNLAIIVSVLALVGVIAWLSLAFIGGITLQTSEIAKLSLALLFSVGYLIFFYCLSLILCMSVKSLSQGLMLCFTIWLVIVLIIPQIGDTMDPDNQVPGGLFKSMHLNKDQEKQVLAHFSGYETVRNAIEELSLTKHYERLSFALLGIKDVFNGKSLVYIFEMELNDVLWILGWLFAGILASYYLMTRRDAFKEAKY